MGLSAVEERVVVFRARSFAEAIRRAEKEAEEYARFDTWETRYGQTLRTKYLQACDAFVLDHVSSGSGEVYSRAELVSSDESDDAVIDALLGRGETPLQSERRRKFDIG